MGAIYAPTSPLARCSVCGVQRQFHAKSDVPHSADRDHEFVAETIADFEPGDLTPEQLVKAIRAANDEWLNLVSLYRDSSETRPVLDRIDAYSKELKARVRSVFGVDWADISRVLE